MVFLNLRNRLIRLEISANGLNFGCDALQGKYQADLDGTVVELDGFEAEPGTIQTVLFSQTGLDNGAEHVLVSCCDARVWRRDSVCVNRRSRMPRINGSTSTITSFSTKKRIHQTSKLGNLAFSSGRD